MSATLTTALSAILPLPEQTLLLRASLLGGAESCRAWEAWKKIVVDPKAAMAGDRRSVKRLLPPLYCMLRESGADVDPAILPYLKLAYVREQMRVNTYRRICGEVLGALNDASIPAIVLRGAALASTVYPDPALRHCHDLSLLVRADDVARAEETIVATGRTRVLQDSRDGGPAALLKDETTLPIELHTQLFSVGAYALEWDDVWPRSECVAIGGAETHILAPEDALAHVCVHASYSESRDSLRWAGDAWHLVRVKEIDWNRLSSTSDRGGFSLPLFVTLRYLRTALDARVPSDTLNLLEASARRASSMVRDVALHGARAGECEELGVLFARMEGGFRVRAVTMMWLLFPSVGYVRHVVGSSSPQRMAAHYLRRPIDYLRRFLLRSSPRTRTADSELS